MFGKDDIKKLLSENYPLLSILIGITLISLSIGPFHNGDTDWEFAAAKGVLRWGIPYVISFGNIINQPPLGFYIEAIIFQRLRCISYQWHIFSNIAWAWKHSCYL